MRFTISYTQSFNTLNATGESGSGDALVGSTWRETHQLRQDWYADRPCHSIKRGWESDLHKWQRHQEDRNHRERHMDSRRSEGKPKWKLLFLSQGARTCVLIREASELSMVYKELEIL